MKKTLQRRIRMLSKYTLIGFLVQTVLFQTLSANTGSAQNVFEVKNTIEIKHGSLDDFFSKIEENTDFSFTYTNSIDLQKNVEVESVSTLGDLLKEIAVDAGLKFKQINYAIVVSKSKVPLVSKQFAPGIIRGRVTDGQSGDVLPGASITIAGKSYGTTSDVEGNYSLRVPAGSVDIIVSYIGFSTLETTVEVQEGQTIVENFTLESDVQELESVTVVGILQGQAKALNQQKTADNIKNIVAAEQIGRFPDPNVAEALQRIPGASVERDQGEGRYVLVRGLAPQFTNISINGEQIPSPEAGIRYVALDAVPADQLASIEVTKALTPDMDGDAVGGSVNLVTRTAKSSDASLNGTIIGGYNELMGQPNMQGSLQYGQRFGKDERLGVLLNSSYYFTERGSDNWERDEAEVELRDYEIVRTRLGLSGTIDYRLSETSEIYLRGIYNRFSDREWRRRYIFIPNVDDSPFEDNEIERTTKDRYESQSITSFNLGGKHVLPKLTVDYEVSYGFANQDTPFDNEVLFIAEPDELSTDFSNPDFPRINALFEDPEALDNDDGRTFTPQTAYLNNRNYAFDELETGTTLTEDRNITGKFNISVPYQLSGNNALLKFGAKARFKEKTLEVTQNIFEWEGADDILLDQVDGGLVDDDFLDGEYELSASADMDQMLRFFNANRNGFALSVEDKIEAENAESFTANEDVFAGYIMSRVNINKLMILGGVRYEKTQVNYENFEVNFDDEGDFDEVTPREGSTDYGYFLPQLHFKYNVNPNTNLRAAATYSYSRPNFENILSEVVVNLFDREVSLGNTELKPVSAFNLDLMGEKYFGTVGVLSGGLFYKKLDDFIYTSIRRQEFRGISNVEVTQAINGSDADLLGVEIAYQQNLTFLPGVLSGLGIYFNYTYTTSTANVVRNDSEEEINLPGQAEHIGNFSLSYNRGKFNTRISANYRGSYIQEVGGEAEEDEYLNDRLQVDWTVAYAVNSKFRLFAEFLNITNEPFEAYVGNENNLIQREFYSWWSRVGLKVNL